jgi:Polysaccharide lyase family 4, domain II
MHHATVRDWFTLKITSERSKWKSLGGKVSEFAVGRYLPKTSPKSRLWRPSAVAVSGTLLLAQLALADPYTVVSVSNGGTIQGVVKLTGSAPSVAPIVVTKNQDYCGDSISNPVYVVGKDGGLQNVEVYLKDITSGKALATDPVAISLVNTHCMFSPRVQAATVGQQITISSEDPVLHNTHPQNSVTNATIYNIALPFKGFSVTKPLPATPQLIKVKCDAHEWMHAWIFEFEHPYFATTGDDGKFIIKDVPPGTYTLVAWQEAAGEKSMPVTVTAGKTVTADIQLAPK